MSDDLDDYPETNHAHRAPKTMSPNKEKGLLTPEERDEIDKGLSPNELKQMSHYAQKRWDGRRADHGKRIQQAKAKKKRRSKR